MNKSIVLGIASASLSSVASNNFNEGIEASCLQVSNSTKECFAHKERSIDLRIGKNILVTEDFSVLGNGDVLHNISLSEEILSDYLQNNKIPKRDLIMATWCEDAR